MLYRRLFVGGMIAILSACFCRAAKASIIVQSTVGGTPTGGTLVNFDNLPLGSAGGTSDGVSVSFSGDGQAVQGSDTGVYNAPYLSSGQGVDFGDPNNGPDTTTYLSTISGSVTLNFPAAETYVGLLWGAVASGNTLSLYNGSTLIGVITATDVDSNPTGNTGADGTFYVNINSTDAFTQVVASSSNDASFNFDNVAYENNAAPNLPEPAALPLLAIGSALLLLRGRLSGLSRT